MSLHTWSHHNPRKPSGCTTFMLNSHWGRAATGKKVLCLCEQDHFGSVQLFATLYTVTCQASLSGGGGGGGGCGSPGKNTGAYWPMLVAIPF